MEMDADHGRWICPYCASVWAPPANFEGVRVVGASDLKCPVCRTKLSQGQLLGYGIFYCETCNGMLVPMDDFIPLTEDLRAQRDTPPYVGLPPNEHDLERSIPCPQCGRPMEAHFYGGPGNVAIDTCENCGFHWLDRGELHRIAMAPDHRYVT